MYLRLDRQESRRLGSEGAWGFGGGGGRVRVQRNLYQAAPAGKEQRLAAGTAVQYRLKQRVDGKVAWVEGVIAEARPDNVASRANPQYYNVYTAFNDSTHWVPLRESEREDVRMGPARRRPRRRSRTTAFRAAGTAPYPRRSWIVIHDLLNTSRT